MSEEDVKNNQVEIEPNLLQKLLKTPYVSSINSHLTIIEKNGKALALLKIKAKARRISKKRKRHEIS